MQRYTVFGDTVEDNDCGYWYHASDVDARIAELEAALREAMEWNWLDEDSPPPAEVAQQCRKAIGL